jgi:hypothetical protein
LQSNNCIIFQQLKKHGKVHMPKPFMQNSKLLALALGIYVTTPPSICVGVGPPLDIVMLAWLVGIST